MKSKMLLLSFLFCAPLLAQYQAVVRMEYWSWQYNGNEMEGTLHADLYLNGQLQPPDEVNYTYMWEKDQFHVGNGEWDLYRYGYSDRHGVTAGDGYNVRVTITGSSSPPAFSVTSSPEYFFSPAAPQRHIVSLFSQLEDGNPTAGLSMYFWASPGWHTAKRVVVSSFPEERYFTNNEYIALLSDPDFRTTNNDKFNRWEDNSGALYYLNHQEFEMSPSQTDITSRYRGVVDGTTLRTDLIDNPSGNTNVMQLKEPWLKDLTDSYGLRNRGLAASFANIPSNGTNNLDFSSSYKGVFLELDPQQGSLIYYTIRAPLTVIISDVTCNFQNWISTNATITSPLNQVGDYYESPVVFTAAGGAVTAKYKAHMATSQPVSYGSQGKIARGAGTMPHVMVYESGGDIWYLRSTDNGATWSMDPVIPGLSQQERVSDGSGVFSSPAVTSFTYSNGGQSFANTYVVWEENPVGNGYRIWARVRDENVQAGGGNAWGSTILLHEDLTARPTAGAVPVISQRLVFWRGPNGILWKQLNNYQSAVGVVPSMNASCGYPSIEVFGSSPDDGTIHLVWEKPGSGSSYGVRYRKGTVTGTNTADWGSAFSEKSIASNSSGSINTRPVVVRDNTGNACVAWEYKNGWTGEIRFRKVTPSGSLTSTTTIESYGSSNFPKSPSISHHRNATSNQDDLTLVWYTPNDGVKQGLYRSGAWLTPYVLSGIGQYTGVSSSSLLGDGLRLAFFAAESGPPYALQAVQVLEPPSMPTLVSPFGAGIPTSTTLNWTPSSATSYQVQIGTDPSFMSETILLDDPAVPTNSRAIGLVPNTTYHWRVRGINAVGTGAWSATGNFTTQTSLTNNTTWVGTVRLVSSVTVPSGITLNVSPGATVTYSATNRIFVSGTINAVGTPGSRITFDGRFTTRGNWDNSLVAFAGSGSGTIAYADFKQSKHHVSFYTSGSLMIDNCTFADFDSIGAGNGVFGYAIYSYFEYQQAMQSLSITNNTIATVNKAGWGIMCYRIVPSSLNISGNTIDACYSGILLYEIVGGYTIGANVIRNCHDGVSAFFTNVIFEDLVMDNNYYGFWVSTASGGSIIRNCTITNPTYIGIACILSSITIQGNSLSTSLPFITGIRVSGSTSIQGDYQINSNNISNFYKGIDIYGPTEAVVGVNLGGYGGNTIDNCQYGFWVDTFDPGGEISIRHNLITGNNTAIGIFLGNEATIENNSIIRTITGGTAVDVVTSAAAESWIQKNTISKWSMGLSYDSEGTAYTSVHQNNIETCTGFIINESYDPGYTVRAENNWWGTTDTSYIYYRLTQYSPIKYKPILTTRVADAGPYGQAPPARIAESPIESKPISERVDSEGELPRGFLLGQNYPNPFNPETIILYQLPHESRVQLIVYDIMGRQVRRLMERVQSAGYYHLEWNATDDNGLPVGSGLYIYKLVASPLDAEKGKPYVATKKMLLLH